MRLSYRFASISACLFVSLMIGPMPHGLALPDWKDAANEMAQKILTATGGPMTASLAVQNISSLGEDDVAAIRRALRAELRKQGVRFVAPARATASVKVTLSENAEGYLWVGEIQKGDSRVVVMVNVSRETIGEAARKEATLAIGKTLLLQEDTPLLDLTVLEAPEPGASRLLALQASGVSLYSRSGPGWQAVQSAQFSNGLAAWPRDPRGRLVVRSDNAFDVYLPGAKCSGTLQPSLGLECRASDDYWPLSFSTQNPQTAQFAASRNYFSGKISSPAGETVLLPFYSAAETQVRGRTLWAYAGVDGRVQILDKGPEPLGIIDGWGSDIAGLKTGCGSGWQILATRSGDSTTSDAVQAFEIAGRQAVPASAPLEFPGPVTALWAAPDGASAIAVSRNTETGKYEASKLSITCGR